MSTAQAVLFFCLMVESFFKYLQFEKRYSPHTITSYSNDLNQFEDFMQAEFPDVKLEDAEHYQLRAWIVSLMEIDLDPRSVNRKISTLKAYYRFLLKREVISKNPTTRLKVLKNSSRLPRFVKEEDMMALLEKVNYEDSFTGKRDQLILEMLYGTGIRLSELLGLTMASINFHKGEIKVIGKRNKERIIPISQGLETVIKQYIEAKTETFPDKNDVLIITDTGKNGYPMLIYRTVKKYLGLFTTLDKRSPHILRHTFATHLLNKGAELNAVKELLGHANLAATQIYTHNSLEKLKEAHKQAHPKA